MVRGGGDSIARTAYSVVRGINRGHLSKLPLNITTSMTGSYQVNQYYYLKTVGQTTQGCDVNDLQKLALKQVFTTHCECYLISVIHQDGFLGKFERVYPDDSVGVEERLPKHYMDFHNQWKKGPQSSIHQIVPQEK